MPLPLGPADTYRCALNWTQNGERCVNVIHVRDTDGSQTPDSIAQQLFDDFGLNMAVGLNNNTTLDFVTATQADSATPLIGTSSGSPYVGVATAQALPNDKAVCATLRTGLGGRSGRGRFYIMGLTIGDITDADPNHLQPANQAAYLTYMNDCLTELVSDDLEWGVMSYYSGVDVNGDPIPRATALFNAVTSISVNARIDTQRRRLPRT